MIGAVGPPVERRIQDLGGEPFCLWYFGRGGRGTVLWLHGTSFNSLCYAQMLGRAASALEGWDVAALDQRGHGESGAAADPARLGSWQTHVDAVAELLPRLRQPVLLAGHSMGGAVAVCAAAAAPGSVSQLLLVDPVVMSGLPPWLQWLQFLRRRRRSGMVASTRRRRSRFSSREEALEFFRGRGIFSTWPAEALAGYVQGGLGAVEAAPENDAAEEELALRCHPDWEARHYQVSTALDVAKELLRLRHATTIAVPARSDVCPPSLQRRILRKRLPVRILRYEATHSLPMELPGDMALLLSGMALWPSEPAASRNPDPLNPDSQDLSAQNLDPQNFDKAGRKKPDD